MEATVYAVDAWHDGEGWYQNDCRVIDRMEAGEIPETHEEILRLAVSRGWLAPSHGCAVNECAGDPHVYDLVMRDSGEPLVSISIDASE